MASPIPNLNLSQKLAKVSQQLSQWLSGPSLPSFIAATQTHQQSQQQTNQQYGQFGAFAPQTPAPQAPEAPSQHAMLGQMIAQLTSGQSQPTTQNLISSSSADIIGDLIAGSVEKALGKLAKLELNIKASQGDPTAISQVALNKEQENKQRQAASLNVGSNLAQPFQRQPMPGTAEGAAWRSSKWIKDFGDGLKLMGGPLSGVLGSVLKGFGGLGTALTSVTAAGRELYNERLGKEQGYAQFSGAMAQVMAESEVRNIRLSRMYGDALAPSARAREQAVGQLQATWAPAGIWMGEIGNALLQVGAISLTRMLQMAGLPAAPMNFMGANPGETGMAVWFSNIENTTWASMYGTAPGIMPAGPVNVVGQ